LLRHVEGTCWEATVGDWCERVDVVRDGSTMIVTRGGVRQRMDVFVDGGRVLLARDGATWSFDRRTNRTAAESGGTDGSLLIVSPMPGTVVGLAVAVGDAVDVGQPVAVVEAMKMEHTLRAPRKSVVRSVAVSVGDRVSRHQQMLVLEAADD
jgi:3-methylcrotonyl-CoA carboxylase alpha subunit